MKTLIQAVTILATIMALNVSTGANAATPATPGTQEFGLTGRQLVQNIEKVEAQIAKCMRGQGFGYVAADIITVRKGMSADKRLPGIGEEEFIEKYGFGISTLYTGRPTQLIDGYSPGKVGLGERNIQMFRNLSSADQVAYNRALLGNNTDSTFAVGLETENFSGTGGCTRTAIEAVFERDQLKASYYNPNDLQINNDPRMKAALREFSAELREHGFDYDHPDDVEADIRERLLAVTGGRTVPVEKMSPESREALRTLQDYERRVGVISFGLAEEIFDPIEELIEREMFARDVN